MAEVLYAGLTYEQVVDNYFQTVASVCVLHIQNNADAQDCFQNTFMKLFEKSPEFESKNHLKAWLIRVENVTEEEELLDADAYIEFYESEEA